MDAMQFEPLILFPVELAPQSGRALPRGGSRMEHRFGRRSVCGTAVRISAGAAINGAGRLRDVSLSGAYVQTALDLPLFGVLSLTKVAHDDTAVEILAAVVRRDADGVGVEWCETPTCSICRIFGCAQPCEIDTCTE